MCRSDQVNFLQNNEDDPQNENESQQQENYDNDPLAFAEFTSRNGWEELQRDNYLMMSISDAFEIKQTAKISEDDLNGHIVKVKIKSAEILAIADSGSPMSFLNETTARQIQQTDKTAIFKTIMPEDKARNLACYNKGHHSKRTINSSNRIRRLDYPVSPIHCGGRSESKHSWS